MNVVELVQQCKHAAEKEGLSLAELGRRVGIDKTQIGHWFRGRYIPSAPNLLALIQAVGLRLELRAATQSQPATSETRPQAKAPSSSPKKPKHKAARPKTATQKATAGSTSSSDKPPRSFWQELERKIREGEFPS